MAEINISLHKYISIYSLKKKNKSTYSTKSIE